MRPAAGKWSFGAAAIGLAITLGGARLALPPPKEAIVSVAETHEHQWDVSLVANPLHRAIGLMGRADLDEKRGMLFAFDQQQPVTHSFWMYQTNMPLDIAFLDRDGVIISTATMTPCKASSPSRCPRYRASKPYHYALELKAGQLDSANLEVGDQFAIFPRQGA